MENTRKTPAFFDALNIAIPFFFMVSGGILFFVLPKKQISEIEKRKLASVPEYSTQALLEGSYTRELEAYVADNFPYRDQWIEFGGNMREWRGFRPEENIKLVATKQPQFLGQNPEDSAIMNSENEFVDGDSNGKSSHSLFIYNKRAYQIFGGGKRTAGIYASKLNYFYNLLKDSVKFYNLVAPSPTDFDLPEKFRKMGNSEKANIDAIYTALEPGICHADAYTTMMAHKDEYMYFATDHHWTALGAYYAYTAFADCAGFQPVALESMTKKSKPGFLGSLYGLSRDEDLKSNPDHVDYYLVPGSYKVQVNQTSAIDKWTGGSLFAEGASGGNSYSVFLGGDFPVLRIKSNANNGRRILVLKESYGNAFSPFLSPHFEYVYVADIRYFKFSLLQFIRKYQINEVLVINGIFMANNPYFPNKIKSMIHTPQAAHSAKKKSTSDSTAKIKTP
jgi:hypothetical protein